MSRGDLERLTGDVAIDPTLGKELSTLDHDPECWFQWAASHGYDLTYEEVLGLMASNDELSDDDLEDVAGGWDGTGGG